MGEATLDYRIKELERQLAAAQETIERLSWKPITPSGVLPEFGERVLIRRQSSVQVGFLTSSNEWCNDWGKVLLDSPTYWMPFPNPPVEAEHE